MCGGLSDRNRADISPPRRRVRVDFSNAGDDKGRAHCEPLRRECCAELLQRASGDAQLAHADEGAPRFFPRESGLTFERLALEVSKQARGSRISALVMGKL